MLEARKLVVGYGAGHRVLRSIDLALEPGEVVALAGPNGAGKSTLLRGLLGITPHSSGEVLADGRAVAAMSHRERARVMAYVPQRVAIGFAMTVFDTVLMGRRARMGWRASPRDLEAVEHWIRSLGLSDLAMRNVDRLSGGQQQKVLLARALAQEGRYLLLDEPTSHLDLRYQLECMQLVTRMAHEQGRGILVALHDLNLVSRYADRVILLHDGTVMTAGPPRDVLDEHAIRRVYGVDAVITDGAGHRHIFAMQPSNHRDGRDA